MNRKYAVTCSLLLAINMLAAACGGSAVSQDTTSAPVQNTEAPSETVSSGVPADLKFGGETVTILNSPYTESDLVLMNISETNGDVVNDAVFRRNIEVMNKLDVQIEYVDHYQNQAWDDDSHIRNAILSADNEYDIIMGCQYIMAPLVLENMFMNLKDMPYIDINQEWWATDYIQSISVGDKRMLVTGDISLAYIRSLGCMYYNYRLYDDYYGDPEEMYDTVLNGEWTMDRLMEMIKPVYSDLNQSNANDEGDLFGLGLVPNPNPIHLFYAAGASVSSKDSNGLPVLDGNNSRNVAIFEKMQELYAPAEGMCVYSAWATLHSAFPEGQLMFFGGYLSSVDSLRNMTDDFGIIPFPKLDETVDSNRTLVHDIAPLAAIPVTSERGDMIAAVLEEMAFQSHEYMLPAYYEVALKDKYMRDSGSKAVTVMENMIGSATTDFAFVYSYALDRIGQVAQQNLYGNYVSAYDSLKTSAETKLKAIIDYYIN